MKTLEMFDEDFLEEGWKTIDRRGRCLGGKGRCLESGQRCFEKIRKQK